MYVCIKCNIINGEEFLDGKVEYGMIERMAFL